MKSSNTNRHAFSVANSSSMPPCDNGASEEDNVAFVSGLACSYQTRPSIPFQHGLVSARTRKTPRQIRTVAIYFHALGLGGGERVTRDLLLMWKEMGYNVILLTDVPPSKDDYDLPQTIKRIVLPDAFSIPRDQYQVRLDALSQVIATYHIDALVYGNWFSPTLPWDLLITKLSGACFSILFHSSFSMFFIEGSPYMLQLPNVYREANGIVCLTKTDQLFWQHFNGNVHQINNPSTIKVEDVDPSPLKGHVIIWPARLHEDKMPEKVIPIMRRVVDALPDARLLMVGPIKESFKESFLKQIEDASLADAIELCGPKTEDEMSRYYSIADAFLLTSEREGWSLALGEALSFGLPCVMYDLQYLPLARDNEAVVSVPVDDAEQAADALVRVLTDKDLASSMGQTGRERMLDFEKHDRKEDWRTFFHSLESSSTTEEPHDNEEESLLWNTLLQGILLRARNDDERNYQLAFAQNDISTLQAKNDGLSQERDALQEERNSLTETVVSLERSLSFRVGRAVTAPMRFLRDKIKGSNRD